MACQARTRRRRRHAYSSRTRQTGVADVGEGVWLGSDAHSLPGHGGEHGARCTMPRGVWLLLAAEQEDVRGRDMGSWTRSGTGVGADGADAAARWTRWGGLHSADRGSHGRVARWHGGLEVENRSSVDEVDVLAVGEDCVAKCFLMDAGSTDLNAGSTDPNATHHASSPEANALNLIVDAFIDIQMDQLDFHRYGSADTQTKQRNLPAEWQIVDWDSDLTSLASDEPENPPASKKSRIDSGKAFKTIDCLPIRGRNTREWNQHLGAAPDIWAEKIKWWQDTMERALLSQSSFECPQSPLSSAILYDSMVLVLRELCHVDKKIYSQESWLLAVKIQLRWTPPDEIKSWTPRAVEFIGFENCNPRIAGGKELIRAFLQYPTLIPHASYPQSVYFALGQANFTRTWHHYLGAGLHSFGYNVHLQNVEALYGDLMQVLHRHRKEKNLHTIPDLSLQTIFNRTLDFKELYESLKNYVYRRKPRLLDYNPPNAQTNTRGVTMPKPKVSLSKSWPTNSCSFCADKKPEQRCVQYVAVKEHPVDESLIGCGVSFASKEYQLPPKPPKKPKRRKDGSYWQPAPPKEILYPLDECLGFSFIEADTNCIQRCGRHLIWIVDEDSGEKLDFVLYEAFGEDHLKKMLRYHDAQTKVKPLVRGQQFNYYSYGKMWVFGTHAAAGSAPGDALRMYEGISADTLDALNSMFNYAEVFNSSISLVLECLILDVTTKSIWPELANDMKTITDEADQLGLTGCNLFECHNFTSCIHKDNNATKKSICCQLFLRAKTSFDGAKEHAVLLPSTEELTAEESQEEPYRAWRIRGGANNRRRESLGNHKTAPAISIQKAGEYQRARELSAELERFYDVPGGGNFM
ncbi:hypothetical protein B0H14DRAFT_2587419 [Mycena olivaceomarginata]|nr:hypothetical protein B0H14DRAFT_2587419 [Mycena olivaceomarginata]